MNGIHRMSTILQKIKDIPIGESIAEKHPAEFVRQEGHEKGMEKI
jgi:hypothetical protein